MSKILNYDPETGVTQVYHKDPNTGLVTVQTKQDVGHVLDYNKKLRASMPSGWKGDFHHVASIPINIINQWKEELKRVGRNANPLATENRKWLMMRLNNSEFKKLRTKEGVL